MHPVVEEQTHLSKEHKKEETTASKIFYDVVNVSEGFQLRTAYKKKVKPSKLDGLLERRVKQFTLEEKQRLERLRQAAFLSKTGGTKSTCGIKTEGSSLNKQPATTLSIKAEEEGDNFKVKDQVVKKLDFEQEHVKTKMDSVDLKSDTTAPSQSKQAEVSAAHTNSEEVRDHKEVNGEPEVNSNCISDTNESKENTQKPDVVRVGENSKKRGYGEMEQSSGQSDAESIKVAQCDTGSSQVNGKTAPADPNVNSDPAIQGEGVTKEPVKSLMNGNLSEGMSTIDHQPPLKVPKLENHVGDKEESLKKSDNVIVNSEGAVPAKLESTSSSCYNSNNTDNNTSNEDLKTSIMNVSSKESQNSLSDTSGSISKPDVTSQAASSSLSPFTVSNTQSSSEATMSQRKRHTDTKVGALCSASASSMTVSKENSTRDRVSLLKFSKSKKARSGTALPSYRKFVTKSSKKSIFVLPNDDLKRLARKAGIREVPIFNYNAKPALDIWPYPSPRPTFGITWRSVAHLGIFIHNFAYWLLFFFFLRTVL